MPTSLRSSPSGKAYDIEASLADYGTQTAWAIDPSTGSDENPGTPSLPLRTMGEFNQRMTGLRVSVPQTLRLVGDVTDEGLCLNGTHYLLGASLAVSGTRTVVASGAITTVTGANFPFQLLTSGIVWTSVAVGAQIRLPSGAVGHLMSVIDANNVVTGQFTSSTSASTVTPANGDAITVETCSASLPPLVDASGRTVGGATSVSVSLFDQVFQSGFNLSLHGGAGVFFHGCEIKVVGQTIEFASFAHFRSCRWTCQGSNTLRTAGQQLFLTNSVVAGTGIGNPVLSLGAGNAQFNSTGFNQCALSVSGGSFLAIATGANGLNFRNTASPVTIANHARVFCNSPIASLSISGSTGNTGVGIEALLGGGLLWNGATNKPTLTAGTPGTNDVRIGGTSMGLAALGSGYFASFLNAIPPTLTNLVGPPGATGGYAFMSQG